MGGSSSKVGTDASVPVPNKIREVVPGVTIETIQAGNGELPRDGQNVAVHYTGTLENGTKFDSSRDRAQPFVFAVGGGQVIRCWDKAVAEMSIGERANVRCSPENAYGSRGIGPIPANSTLNFDVEILKHY